MTYIHAFQIKNPSVIISLIFMSYMYLAGVKVGLSGICLSSAKGQAQDGFCALGSLSGIQSSLYSATRSIL